MKVFVVISDVVYDYEGTPCVAGVYTDATKAVERMDSLFDSFMDEGWIDKEMLEDDNNHTFTKRCKEVWQDGYYSQKHIAISVHESELED